MRQTEEKTLTCKQMFLSYIIWNIHPPLHKFKLKMLMLKEEADVNVICYLPKSIFPWQAANVPV